LCDSTAIGKVGFMKSFRRIFEYIWPQWRRLAVVFASALVVGVLFAFSVGTVLPLLKIMMGEEGLRGWADRLIVKDRYGMSFYLPDKVDLSKPDMMYYLRIVAIEDKEAAKAGLQENDRIVGAGNSLLEKGGTNSIPSAKLLEELATTSSGKSITVQYRRVRGQQFLFGQVQFPAPAKPFYADIVQRSLSFVSREQGQESSKQAVIFIILLLVVVTAVRCTARFYQDYTVRKVVHTTVARLREEMFARSLTIPVGFFAESGSSDTVSRLIRDSDMAGNGVKILFGKALREPLKALFLIVVAMAIDYKLTLIFLCGVPAALYVLGNLGRKMKRATRKTLLSWSAMLRNLQEVTAGMKVVKVYNRQEHENRCFWAVSCRLLKQQFRIAKVDSLSGPVLETLGMIAGSVGLLFAVGWVYENRMEPSEFFTLLIALGVTADALRKTSDVWNKVQMSNAAAERVYAVIDQPLEFEKVDAMELEPLKEKIEFQDVRFSYPGSEVPVLNGINLTVRAGQNVAIVGPNGSGKTTLANLLPRFYNPDSGRILIDGKDIMDASLASLRGQIGMVTQNVVTFNNSIAANIAYSKAGAGRQEIIEAAKRAYADEFIAPLAAGYDTVIGEQGAGLSGGQLQRIVIARAILKNPAILIFDEATSQVDADSEAKIHEAIEAIMHGRTSFIIAHRFSTVINADLIVVMDRGRIIAQGQHSELMDSCLLYQSLYETQLVGT